MSSRSPTVRVHKYNTDFGFLESIRPMRRLHSRLLLGEQPHPLLPPAFEPLSLALLLELFALLSWELTKVKLFLVV